MTIAVLGATGMVGSRVIAEAVARGHRVLALSRKPGDGDPNVTPVAVDVCDPEAVHEALAGAIATGAVATGTTASGATATGVTATGNVATGTVASGTTATGTVASGVTATGTVASGVTATGTVASGTTATGATPPRPPDAVVLSVRTFPADREFLVGATRTVLDAAARLGTRVLVVGGAGALRSPGDPDLPVADNRAYVPDEYRAVALAGTAQLRTCEAHADADWVYLSPPAELEPGERTGRYRRGTDTLLTASDDGRSWISAEDLAVAVVDEVESPGTERHITVVHRPSCSA
ncbi:NAD(P)-dependent oxidoreductase [Streptomyces chartreusis]|uniref:NAD(P)-dependent oxidoreductase n=1 Tax=Streptomyces chartreusis TaxID=1969 RepID=UPI0035DF19F9